MFLCNSDAVAVTSQQFPVEDWFFGLQFSFSCLPLRCGSLCRSAWILPTPVI